MNSAMVRVRHQRAAHLGGTASFPGLPPWLARMAARGLGSYNTVFADQVTVANLDSCCVCTWCTACADLLGASPVVTGPGLRFLLHKKMQESPCCAVCALRTRGAPSTRAASQDARVAFASLSVRVPQVPHMAMARPEVAAQLREALQHNLVLVNSRWYRQKRGIPQVR